MTDDVAAFHVIVLFGTLMRNMAQKDDGIAGFGVNDGMFLFIAPGLKVGVFNFRIQVRWLRKMAVLYEFEMALAWFVILKVKSRIDAAGLYRQPVFSYIALFVPIAVKIHMPFLEVWPRINMGPVAS